MDRPGHCLERPDRKEYANAKENAQEAPGAWRIQGKRSCRTGGGGIGPAAGTSQEPDWEVDRQRLEDEIKSRDEIIKELNRQIRKSHQIDIEIEKKERGLLY